MTDNDVARFEYIVTDAGESFLWRKDDYPWERNVWNFHPEVEIHLVTNASGIRLVGDHIGEFQPGEVTVVGSNLPHDWVTPVAPGEIIRGRDIVIQFLPDKLLAAAQILPELRVGSDFLERAKRGLCFHAETRLEAGRIIRRMEDLAGLSRLAALLELIDLLQSSDEHTILSSRAFSPALETESLAMLQRVLTHVMSNVSVEIYAADVAQLVGMTPSAFSRFFRKHSGLTFTDHVRKLRISKACKLLSDTEMPISDIVFDVGFHNISNFNRAFRQHNGMTPSLYRRLAPHRKRTRQAESGV